MTQEDRFGLKGDPEIQQARRVTFGGGLLGLFLLVLATLITLLEFRALWTWTSFPPQHPGTWLRLLVLPLLAYSWYIWHKDRKLLEWFALAFFGIKYLGSIIDDLTFGDPVDRWDVGLVILMAVGLLFYARSAWLNRSK